MKTDRYVRSMLTLIAVAVTVIAIALWLPGATWVRSALELRKAEAQKAANIPAASIPKVWGKLVAAGPNVMFFEHPDGTLRVASYALDGSVNEVLLIYRK